MTPSRRILILSAGCSCGRGAEMNALLVYYSIHYVFDRAKKDPSLEEDPPNPLKVYGASKLASNRSNQRACPVASIPTRTLTSLRCRSR